MTRAYGDDELVHIGQTKGLLLEGQPSTAWGAETEISVRCVATGMDDGGSYGDSYGEIYGGTATTPRSKWYELFRDYARHAGADAFGRLEDGSPWVEDSSRNHWPVDSNIVQIEYGAEYHNAEDVWALLTAIEDESTPPSVYELTVTFVPLAFAADYADREALLAEIPKPSIQL